MLTTVCTDGDLIDLMKTPGIADNLQATSDQQNFPNVIPENQGVWTPESWDDQPVLNIQLSSPPEDKKLVTIVITAQNFQSVTVTLKNTAGNYIFSVSYFLCHIYVEREREIMLSDITGKQYFVSATRGDYKYANLSDSIFQLFSARQHAERAICYRPSVRLSVCLSVRPSVCHTGGSVKNGWTYHRNSFTIW